jgi:elongation factor Ts
MNTEAIKQLRERTYLSMTVCKKALEQVQDDVEKAVELLQKQNVIKTVDPLVIPREGVVRAKTVDGNGRIVEVNCQTDFCAKSEVFISLTDTILISGDRNGLIQNAQNQLGEKIVLKKWNTLDVGQFDSEKNVGLCRYYNHHNGKIAVLISAVVEEDVMENEKVLAFLDDCAIQIAANKPLLVSTDNIASTQEYTAQKAIFEEQVKDKPEKMREKIVSGKFEAWYREVVLVKQESVVHPKNTIQALQEKLEKEIGSKIVIADFIRYELGA